MDHICDYDEGYSRVDASEIGFCGRCNVNPECPMKRKGSRRQAFTIRCNNCGSTHVQVTAFEHWDLGIQCMNCGKYENVGCYESQ